MDFFENYIFIPLNYSVYEMEYWNRAIINLLIRGVYVIKCPNTDLTSILILIDSNQKCC